MAAMAGWGRLTGNQPQLTPSSRRQAWLRRCASLPVRAGPSSEFATADGPCRAIEIVARSGQLYATDQLTPDRDCTRYSKSASEGRYKYGPGADLVSHPECRNDHADDGDHNRKQHPVLQRDQAEHQVLVDEPVLQGRPPVKGALNGYFAFDDRAPARSFVEGRTRLKIYRGLMAQRPAPRRRNIFAWRRWLSHRGP
jgi:hypothetical protein